MSVFLVVTLESLPSTLIENIPGVFSTRANADTWIDRACPNGDGCEYYVVIEHALDAALTPEDVDEDDASWDWYEHDACDCAECNDRAWEDDPSTLTEAERDAADRAFDLWDSDERRAALAERYAAEREARENHAFHAWAEAEAREARRDGNNPV
jgi:hypothetical protein